MRFGLAFTFLFAAYYFPQRYEMNGFTEFVLIIMVGIAGLLIGSKLEENSKRWK